jgi:hypothetical protein
MNKNSISIILILALLFDSCKKTDHSTLLTSEDFPTTVGSWWEYQEFNPAYSYIDTATVVITDTQIIQGVAYQRWVTTYRGVNASPSDTQYVLVTDTLIAFNVILGNSQPTFFNLKFPIIDNESWSYYPNGINNASIQNISVNDITYNGSIYLNRSVQLSLSGGNSTTESVWIVKNVGIVQESIGNSYRQILIAYHIN